MERARRALQSSVAFLDRDGTSIPHRDSMSDGQFIGQDDMEARVRTFDWSQTPLGDPSGWPQSLKTIVRILLTSRYAMWMGWGPDLTFLYNDTYAKVTLGRKHPWALGKPAGEVWSEIWDELRPRVDRVLATGIATWDEALLLFLERSGYPEETYHTFSYSPLEDDSGVTAGMLCVVTEETDRVIGERRLRSLRELSAELTSASSEAQVLDAVSRSLERNDKDLPFALVYLLQHPQRAQLAARSGIESSHPAAPLYVEADPAAAWPLFEPADGAKARIVENLGARFAALPQGAWSEPPRSAVLVPLQGQNQETPLGFLIAGLSPFRPFDPEYKGFLNLLGGQIAAAIANARAYEEEKRRAESLAEIDRAKTTFFTNISHEFRTPLTLMLGPLEDLAASDKSDSKISVADREELRRVHRNATRLLKLVNNLLEFSSIEAGRATAKYQLTDLPAYTAELASVFRAATKKAEIELNVRCEPFRSAVAIDREMWEKIVLNLISNAFKFTLEGSISVLLSEDRDREEFTLTIADTGIGIPAAEIPRLFERFHRIEGGQGRSFEGTGIGLALVNELVRLHGGRMEVASQPGQGTSFTVIIPCRRTVDSVEDPSAVRPGTLALTFSDETARWLPDELSGATRHGPSQDQAAQGESLPGRARILLADDNVDMRDYVERLLSANWDVLRASNGKEALEIAVRECPELIISDVMMPEMDGFELLRALRANVETRSIPVIMLSARAGEEAQIEGLQAGADDYLIKPFSARELMARVATQLALRQRSSQFETLVRQAPIGIIVIDAQFRIQQVNPVALPAFGDIPNLIGTDFRDIMRKLWAPAYADEVVAIYEHTLATGEPYSTPKRSEYRVDRERTEYYEWRVDRISMPGTGYGLVCYFRDISIEVLAEDALRKSEKLAAVGRLASTISHEINNPLEAVTNLLYLIKGEVREESTRFHVELAEQELHRASEVVRHSLKFHRQPTKPAPEALSELLDSTLAVYEPRFRQGHMDIHRKYLDSIPVCCFSSELRQVFANLLSNAFDALQPGGSLRLVVRNSRNWRTGEPGVRVAVADTGSGMSKTTLQHIFEPFFTTKGMQGTGLGLWVTTEILDRHQATVKIRSRQAPGPSGTIFYLFFPATGVSGNEAPRASPV
jgi:PAS domain S-box-containing protein